MSGLEQQRPDHFLTRGITRRALSADLFDRHKFNYSKFGFGYTYLDKLLGGFGLFVAWWGESKARDHSSGTQGI